MSRTKGSKNKTKSQEQSKQNKETGLRDPQGNLVLDYQKEYLSRGVKVVSDYEIIIERAIDHAGNLDRWQFERLVSKLRSKVRYSEQDYAEQGVVDKFLNKDRYLDRDELNSIKNDLIQKAVDGDSDLIDLTNHDEGTADRIRRLLKEDKNIIDITDLDNDVADKIEELLGRK